MLDVTRFIDDGVGLLNNNIIRHMEVVNGSGILPLTHTVDKKTSIAVELSTYVFAAEEQHHILPTISADGTSVTTNGNSTILVIEFNSCFVKSYQSGTYTADSLSYQNPYKIDINEVVPENCLIIYSGGKSLYSTPKGSYDIRSITLDTVKLYPTSFVTTLKVSGSKSLSSNFEWQIIEFKKNIL